MAQSTIVEMQPVRYLSEKKVAELTGFSLSKIQQDRFYRRGLPYVKLGKAIRYSLADVIAFMESHKINHGDQGVA